ncbi:DUF4233 domain-containing protein [Microbacteriaceae bacterium VKM Ac-2855]|nr:DUF4233 domain-containing protein [Microbacteriaceae bacterium VKM Ac-2855]
MAGRLRTGAARSGPRSVRQSLASITLGFESIVMFLAALVTFGLKATSPLIALGGGAVVCLALVAAVGLLRSRYGYVFGWVLQFVIVATGVFVPIMFLIGAAFVALWTYCMVTGARLDAETARHLAANTEQPPTEGDH